jgi:hypothetical protein
MDQEELDHVHTLPEDVVLLKGQPRDNFFYGQVFLFLFYCNDSYCKCIERALNHRSAGNSVLKELTVWLLLQCQGTG